MMRSLQCEVYSRLMKSLIILGTGLLAEEQPEPLVTDVPGGGLVPVSDHPQGERDHGAPYRAEEVCRAGGVSAATQALTTVPEQKGTEL